MTEVLRQLDDSLNSCEGSLEDVCRALDVMFGAEEGTAMDTVFPRMMRTMIACKVDPNAVWVVKKMSDTAAHIIRRAANPCAHRELRRAGWLVTANSMRVFDKTDMQKNGVVTTDDPEIAACFLREKILFAVSGSRYGVVSQHYPRQKL